MEIKEKISLELLTKDSVSIVTTRTILDNGYEYKTDYNHRQAFVNSAEGRKDLHNYLYPDYKHYEKAVLNVWGLEPTIF